VVALSEFRNMNQYAREAYFRLTKRWARIRQKHYPIDGIGAAGESPKAHAF